MQIEPTTLVLAAAAYMLAMVVISFKPAVGLLLVISISVVKSFLRLKMPALMESFTYDMAIVLLGVMAAVVHRLRSGSRVVSLPTGFIVCWVFFALLLWIRLPSSRSFDYGMKKALIFSVFNTLACIVFVLYVTSWQDMTRAIRTFVFLGVLASMGMLMFGEATTQWSSRVSILGTNVLASAAPSIQLLLIAIAAWLADQKLWRLVLLVAALPLSIYAIILSGTRAGLVLTPIAVLWLLWMYRRRIRMQAVIGVAAGTAVVSALVIFVVDPGRFKRFGGDVITDDYASRMTLVYSALDGFAKRPLLGNGTGDWGYQWGGVGGGWYPHNHALEVANELGLIGLIPYLILMGYGLRACFRMSARSWDGTQAKRCGAVVSACFVYYLLESLKSGTFSASYITYVFLVLTVMVEVMWRQETAMLQVDEQYSQEPAPLSTAQVPRYY